MTCLFPRFLKDLAKRVGCNVEGFLQLREFQKYSWSGNVRELRNVIGRNLILNSGPVLHAELPNALQDKKNVFATAG